METSNMKNIVVLKNLPSNLVEEAIVILKENKKVKKLELADQKNKNKLENEEVKNKEYILKEAEMLVSSYIDKTQNNKKINKMSKSEKRKYARLKKYSIIVTVLLLISLILNFMI
jgi:hypothetical protein